MLAAPLRLRSSLKHTVVLLLQLHSHVLSLFDAGMFNASSFFFTSSQETDQSPEGAAEERGGGEEAQRAR